MDRIGPDSSPLRLIIVQGQSFDLPCGWAIGGELVDLGGYTARMQIRRRPGSLVLLDLSSEAPESGDEWIQAITLGPFSLPDANGDEVPLNIRVQVDGEVTGELDFDGALWDLFLYGGDSDKRLLFGPVRLDQEITRE